MTDLSSVKWLVIGATDEYAELKRAIGNVCRDVTHAACIDEICIHDIVATFKQHGYKVLNDE